MSLCGGEGVYAGLDEPEIGLNGTIYMILDGYTSGEQAPCSLQAVSVASRRVEASFK
jgi:hypothetical protein